MQFLFAGSFIHLTDAFLFLSFILISLTFLVLQCLWHSALSTGRPSTFESIPEHILCSCHIFDGRVRRFRSGYMAFSALYGDYDLCGTHRTTDTGESMFQPIVGFIAISDHFLHFCCQRDARSTILLAYTQIVL